MEKFMPGETFPITTEAETAALEALYEEIRNKPELQFIHQIYEQIPSARVALVGGIVRDAVLGLKSKDYDFIIEGIEDTDQLFSVLEASGKAKDVPSRAYGVIKFQPEGVKEPVDIALPRTERYEEGKRATNAEVEYGKISIEEDFSRRDFTINALGLDFQTGEVIDPYNGLEDVADRRIRCVGNPEERFQEDPGRILRGIRFAAKFGFSIDQETLEAMKAKKEEIVRKFIDGRGREIERVAPEKIGEELMKALDQNPALTLELCDQIGLLPLILPELDRLHDLEQPPEWHTEGDAYDHTILLLQKLSELEENPDYQEILGKLPSALRVAAVFHDVGKVETQTRDEKGIRFLGHDKVSVELTKGVLNRLRINNDETKDILWLIEHHMQILQFDKMKLANQKKMARNPLFPSLIALGLADARASVRQDGTIDEAFAEQAIKVLNEVRSEEEAGRPKEIINGNEIIEIVKEINPEFNPAKDGRTIGELKNHVNALYDTGELTTKEEAFDWVKKNYIN